jgi:hypothetical protein
VCTVSLNGDFVKEGEYTEATSDEVYSFPVTITPCTLPGVNIHLCLHSTVSLKATELGIFSDVSVISSFPF